MATVTTAPWLGGMRGRLANVYFAETPHGTQMRALPERRKAATPGEVTQRRRVARVAEAWRNLDREAMAAWRAYAEGVAGVPATGKASGVSAYNAYLSLGSTLLRLRPEGTLPSVPPTGPFFGDAAIVRAVDTPTLPSPKGEGSPSVTFRASQGNAAGVVTELLIQPLLSAGRTPRPKGYVSAGFVSFAEGSLEATVEAPAGWVACAYRFVRADTGQETALAPCGVVRA